MTNLDAWIIFGEKMVIGDREEVYYWEDPVSPGYTNDLCLFLYKPDKDTFCFYIEAPERLAPIQDTEAERDEDPDFYPDEIDGSPVRRTLGEYYIGYDFVSYPDPEASNEIEFTDFSDPKIADWLKRNRLQYSLDKIIPGEITTSTW